MIKSLELKCFRKHEDTKLDFTRGLNVLRGPNEVGKTTVTEGILYALYGAPALIDKLEEVVTWGKKESSLKVTLVVAISGSEYVFTRSKAGAECTYTVKAENGSVTDTRVTGQKEVTAFASALLGADAKTASVLMLSSQAGLRGALDEGPAAVGALMGKLADFDTIDRLLESATQTLMLGSTAPLYLKQAQCELDVADALARVIDPAILIELDAQVAGLTSKKEAETAKLDVLLDVVEKADKARDVATANNSAFQSFQDNLTGLTAKLGQERERLVEATKASLLRPDPAAVASARDALLAAKNHALITDAYKLYGTLGSYPAVAWDEDQASFEAEVVKMKAAKDDGLFKLREVNVDIEGAKNTYIVGGGKCLTCGHVADDADHVAKHNADVKTRIDMFFDRRVNLELESKAQHAAVAQLETVTVSARRRQAIVDKMRPYVKIDESVFPSRVEWIGYPPSDTVNLASLKSNLDTLEQQERSAVLAEGRATAHAAAVKNLDAEVASAIKVLALLSLIPLAPLDEAYETAYSTYTAQGSTVRAITDRLYNIGIERAETQRVADGRAGSLALAQARVIEYVSDIKAMEFNNELVKKLKSMKPMITDFLWAKVLGAVSNFFSTLRGEQSIVTKDATGFKVNGRGGSLSGSTLDVLALSIRVALSKTFVPHASFMILDEPAHGADEVRTGNILGFLQGVGFDQTILASHDPLSESVADNVITLGV